MARLTMPKVIGITGGSASGKSTLARRLYEMLGSERSSILSQDDYYIDWVEGQARPNFDHPSSIELDLMYRHIELLDRGSSARIPTYDFVRQRRTRISKILAPKEILLLDGTLILTHPLIRDRLDYCVYLDFSPELRLQRRLQRDIRERGRTQDAVQEQFREQVQPMHEIFVEPLKHYADLIVDTEEGFEDSIWELARVLNPKKSLAQFR